MMCIGPLRELPQHLPSQRKRRAFCCALMASICYF